MAKGCSQGQHSQMCTLKSGLNPYSYSDDAIQKRRTTVTKKTRNQLQLRKPTRISCKKWRQRLHNLLRRNLLHLQPVFGKSALGKFYMQWHAVWIALSSWIWRDVGSTSSNSRFSYFSHGSLGRPSPYPVTFVALHFCLASCQMWLSHFCLETWSIFYWWPRSERKHCRSRPPGW